MKKGMIGLLALGTIADGARSWKWKSFNDNYSN